MDSELRFAGGVTDTALVVRRNARAKTMRLRVDPRKATITLTLPLRASERRGLAWAEGKRAWVERMLAHIPERSAIARGSVIPLCGVPHRVEPSGARSRTVTIADGLILVGGPEESIGARAARWLRRHALETLSAETHAFADKAGVRVKRVGIGDPVSRWGSCSAGGAIRYNWRLILAPQWVRRATVAHEVAHRVHMNHGPAFHALVESLLGSDPKAARLWLRRHGAGLHRIATGL